MEGQGKEGMKASGRKSSENYLNTEIPIINTTGISL